MKKAILIAILLAVVIGILSVSIVLFSRDADGKKSELSTFDKYDYWTWFDDSDDNLISREDVKKIREDMTFEEVVSILGRPKRDVGSGAYVMEWDMESSEVLLITFNPAIPIQRTRMVCDDDLSGVENFSDLVVCVMHVKPAK